MKAIVRNSFVCGRWQDNPPPEDATLMIADPVYGSEDVLELVKMAVDRRLPSAIFMWPDDVWGLPVKPDQLLHWIKPESTKNTSKRYSRFVEVIACYGLTFAEPMHWSNRTGIFTDRLFRNDDHKWKKPESLIERLIRNHWPRHGVVYDPCAGSRTVETVCRRLGIGSVSVDIANRHYTTVCPECRAIDEPKKEIAQISELCVLIEKVWREYQNLQDQYRKLTGKEHVWL